MLKTKADNQSSFPESIASKTTLLNDGSSEDKRLEVLDYFHKSFDLYESLYECLIDDDAFYARANPLRHPLIFYYGHTAVFFINKLNVATLIDESPQPRTPQKYRQSSHIPGGTHNLRNDTIQDTTIVISSCDI